MPLEVVGSNGKRFITDFGESLTAVSNDGEEMHIARYGVWHKSGDNKPIVIYTTDYLDQAEKVMNELTVQPKKEK